MEDLKKIGFVGLGNMGRPMASHLVAAGFTVTVFDLNPETQRDFLEKHQCRGASSPAEVGADSELVITMLPNSKAVASAVTGDGNGDGLLDSMANGTILVDMSSSSPLGTREMGTMLHDRGISMVDAPVSGGVGKAEAGTLSIMVGGDPEVIQRCEPVLKAMGDSIFLTGHLGSGHAVKALNNMLSAAGFIAAAEVLLVGRRFGLDLDVMLEVLNASTGRNNSTENKFEKYVFSGKFDSGFSLDLMVKDITIAADLARATGTSILFGSACRELCSCALDNLGKGADHTAVAKWFEELCHTDLRTNGAQ